MGAGLEPAGWQRRNRYALRTATVDEDPWHACPTDEATDMFKRAPAYEYRQIFARARSTKEPT